MRLRHERYNNNHNTVSLNAHSYMVFSYAQLVGYMVRDVYYVIDESFSRTTTKHINHHMNNRTEVIRMSEDGLTNLIQETFVADYHLNYGD